MTKADWQAFLYKKLLKSIERYFQCWGGKRGCPCASLCVLVRLCLSFLCNACGKAGVFLQSLKIFNIL